MGKHLAGQKKGQGEGQTRGLERLKWCKPLKTCHSNPISLWGPRGATEGGQQGMGGNLRSNLELWVLEIGKAKRKLWRQLRLPEGPIGKGEEDCGLGARATTFNNSVLKEDSGDNSCAQWHLSPLFDTSWETYQSSFWSPQATTKTIKVPWPQGPLL